MCHAYQELFIELKGRNITGFSDAVIYSYVLTYQMYLNSMEEQIFEYCVDARLLGDPINYCNRTIVGNLNLTLWTQPNKIKACQEGAELVKA